MAPSQEDAIPTGVRAKDRRRAAESEGTRATREGECTGSESMIVFYAPQVIYHNFMTHLDRKRLMINLERLWTQTTQTPGTRKHTALHGSASARHLLRFKLITISRSPDGQRYICSQCECLEICTELIAGSAEPGGFSQKPRPIYRCR